MRKLDMYRKTKNKSLLPSITYHSLKSELRRLGQLWGPMQCKLCVFRTVAAVGSVTQSISDPMEGHDPLLEAGSRRQCLRGGRVGAGWWIRWGWTAGNKVFSHTWSLYSVMKNTSLEESFKREKERKKRERKRRKETPATEQGLPPSAPDSQEIQPAALLKSRMSSFQVQISNVSCISLMRLTQQSPKLSKLKLKVVDGWNNNNNKS